MKATILIFSNLLLPQAMYVSYLKDGISVETSILKKYLICTFMVSCIGPVQ